MSSFAEESFSLSQFVENCLGCKWTVHVLLMIRSGVNRPGALERSVDGLTAKVLSERLAKLVRLGLIERTSFPEIPPRVEYSLTAIGGRMVEILDDVRKLRGQIESATVGEMPALSVRLDAPGNPSSNL